MSSTVLPLFWNLASAAQDTRLAASADLVSSLQTSQGVFSRNAEAGPSGLSNGRQANGEARDSDDDDDEDEEDEDVDVSEGEEEGSDGLVEEKQFAADNASDVVYTVKRLLRGLASSRESSRLGFAVALTEILNRIHTVSPSYVLSTLLRSTTTSKSMRGHEERDALFARLFGLLALIDSGCLWRAGGRADGQTIFGQVTDELLKLGQAKSWMRESAWWGVSRSVVGLQDSQASWKSEALLELVEKTFEEKGLSREQLAVWLVIEQLGVDIDWKARLAPHIKKTPLLARENLAVLSRALKGLSEDDTDGQKVVSGPSRAQLHFVWSTILDRYLVEESGKTNQAPFDDFWREVVEDGLFGQHSTPQQRYHGLQLFQLALQRIPPNHVPTLFSAHFMHCLINNLLAPDRYLHKAAQAATRGMQEAVKARPALALSVIAGLTEKNGRYDFDRATKTKTVEVVIGHLPPEAVEAYADKLIHTLLRSGRNELTEDSGESRQVWATEQMSLICSNGSIVKVDEWVEKVLQTLLLHGFFMLLKPSSKSDIMALRHQPEESITASVAEACRTAFFSCLASLTTIAPTRRALEARPLGTDSNGTLWLERAVSWAVAISKDKKHAQTLFPVQDEAIQGVLGASSTLIGNLPLASDATQGARILLSWLYLQVLGAATETIDDGSPQDEAVAQLASATASIAEILEIEVADLDLGDEAQEGEPIDRLVAHLLSLLEEASSDARVIANTIFGLLSEELTSSAVGQMGQQLLLTVGADVEEASDIDEAEDEDEVAESEAGEAELGQEEAQEDEDEDDDDDDDEEEEETSDESDDEDEELPPVDPEFRKKVAAALGLTDSDIEMDSDAADSEAESALNDELEVASEEAESGEEVYLDDEAMLKMDEQLADVFRLQAQQAKKTDARQLETDNLHYRSRVLDFFDILLQKQATNPVVFEAFVPLLQLAGSLVAARPELSNKVGSIIRSRIGKAKEVPALAATDGRAIQVLAEIHEMVRKSASAEVSALCSLCSLFIVKAIDASNNAAIRDSAVKVYTETTDDFMLRKQSSVHPPFLLDFVRRYPVVAWPLADNVVQHILPTSTVKAFRQIQAFGILTLFSQSFGAMVKSVPSEEIEAFIKNCASAIIDTLSQAASGSIERRTDLLREMVKLALHLARTSKSVIASEAYQIAWNRGQWEVVLGAMKDGKSTRDIKAVHGMVQQLLSIIGKSESKKQSAQASANGGTTVHDGKKRKAASAPASAPDTVQGRKDKKKKRKGVETPL